MLRLFATLAVLLEFTGLVFAQTVGPADRYLFNPIGTGARMVAGSGSPEGSVTAAVGSTYHQTDTGNVYVKASGSGNTGWQYVYRVGGTDVSVGDGGTGVSSLTSNGVLYGNGASNVLVTAAGPTNSVLTASGGAPSFSANPTVDNLSTALAVFVGTDIQVGDEITTPSSNDLRLTPTGDLVTDPAGNDVLPNLGYDINIGLLNKKYLALHAAELWVETLVAQNTIATIGGRILVGPTTTIVIDMGTGDTTIHVKHNEMANGDRAYMEADGKVEFFAMTSGPSGHSGHYDYTVTRNLDGTGANTWAAGDAMFNTGTTGDGFLDIYSINGMSGTVASSGIGPTIVGNVRLSTTYNDWSPRWAIGNLNNTGYGYGANNVYGAAFGDPLEANITVDATNGIRIRDGSTNKLTMSTAGDLDLVGNIVVGTAGVVRSGATAFGTGTGWWIDYNAGTPRFRAGNPSGNRLQWDGTNITVVSDRVTIGSTGIALTPDPTTFTDPSAYKWTVSSGLMRLAAFDSGNQRALVAQSSWTGAGDYTPEISLSSTYNPSSGGTAHSASVYAGANTTAGVVILQTSGANSSINLQTIGGGGTIELETTTNVTGTLATTDEITSSSGITVTNSGDNDSLIQSASDGLLNMNFTGAASTRTYINFLQGDSSGSITCSDTTCAYNTTSDEKLKQNIRPTAMGLNDLLKIPVRDYSFVSAPTENRTGFVAQELAAIYPEAVTPPTGGGGYWQVDYSKLTPLLVKAIQDLEARVRVLEK